MSVAPHGSELTPIAKPLGDSTLVMALHNPANEAVECEAMGHPPGPGSTKSVVEAPFC